MEACDGDKLTSTALCWADHSAVQPLLMAVAPSRASKTFKQAATVVLAAERFRRMGGLQLSPIDEDAPSPGGFTARQQADAGESKEEGIPVSEISAPEVNNGANSAKHVHPKPAKSKFACCSGRPAD